MNHLQTNLYLEQSSGQQGLAGLRSMKPFVNWSGLVWLFPELRSMAEVVSLRFLRTYYIRIPHHHHRHHPKLKGLVLDHPSPIVSIHILF